MEKRSPKEKNINLFFNLCSIVKIMCDFKSSLSPITQINLLPSQKQKKERKK